MPRKHEPLAARPFRYSADGQLLCDAVPLERLAARYGTPLYCYSATQVRERLVLFRKQFARQEHLICYAVKANSNLSLLRMIARDGRGLRHRLRRGTGARACGRTSGPWRGRCFPAWARRRTRWTWRCGRAFCCSTWRASRSWNCWRSGQRSCAAGAHCAAREPGCICGDASVYLDGSAGAQVRHRHPRARAVYARAAQSKWLAARQA